jgi:hypothetical protein
MTPSNHALPASLRKPMEAVRFATPLSPRAKPYLVTGLESRIELRVDAKATGAIKGRFIRLPQEPEDARITGVTRSLNRRLLGLNLGGSLNRTGQALIA